MIRLHAISMLQLFGVAVFLAFTMQIVVTQAEHVGLFDCQSVSSFLASSDDAAKDVPTEDCHAACCGHITGVFTNFVQFVALFHTEQSLLPLIDEHAPDGPVKAIDHPPQLS